MIEPNKEYDESTDRLLAALERLNMAIQLGLPNENVWRAMVEAIAAVTKNQKLLGEFVIENLRGVWRLTNEDVRKARETEE